MRWSKGAECVKPFSATPLWAMATTQTPQVHCITLHVDKPLHLRRVRNPGIVSLDAMIMDGETMDAGCVGYLRGFRGVALC
jgi:hypothetical protein